jgi:hypothetical protein
MTATSPFSPALAAFRVWQAIDPPAVVEAMPLDAAFEAFEAATAPSDRTIEEIHQAQAISLNIISCRLFEMAADTREDWPKFSGLIDLALRAQDQCRQSLESAHHLSRSNEHGQP